MFQPHFAITNQLLANIKQINMLVGELNNRQFPRVVMVELERVAREVSAHASTSIEGNPLPLTEVKKILKSKPEHIRESEKEVLNYNEALEKLNEKLRDRKVMLSIDLILTIQKQVMKDLLPSFEVGRLREQPVVVNNPRTGQIIFLPPDAKDVKTLLEELITFINNNRGKIDPLIQAGIFHKQMVLIHPFIDGNGRTTRLATKVLLAEMGLNTFNLFSFENYYNNNITLYFHTVGELGNYYELIDIIDFTTWLEYFTGGIIDELLRVKKQLATVLATPQTQLHPYHEKILAFIKEKGFITDRDYAKLTKRAKATRALDFQKLIELKRIERKGKGRATYYVLAK